MEVAPGADFAIFHLAQRVLQVGEELPLSSDGFVCSQLVTRVRSSASTSRQQKK
jgi:hypothetical protein